MASLPPGPFRRVPDLRIRPVWEWDGCVVFDPARHLLIELNLHAWLVLELCDGRGIAALVDEYRAIAAPRLEAGTVERDLARALTMLSAHGLVQSSANAKTGDTQ